jgi:hypothetical protein
VEGRELVVVGHGCPWVALGQRRGFGVCCQNLDVEFSLGRIFWTSFVEQL